MRKTYQMVLQNPRDSDTTYSRATGTIAHTFAAETMAVGRRNRALQRAADTRRRVAKRTASWLAPARLGLDCHGFTSWRQCTRVRLMGTAAVRALSALHRQAAAQPTDADPCGSTRVCLVCTENDGLGS